MPAGLEVWNQFGIKTVEITTRIPRFLGTYYIAAGVSGAIMNDGILTGDPQCFCTMHATGVSTWPGNDLAPPSISFAGNQLFYGPANSPHRLQIWVF